jgi:hypothetical protein
MNMNKSLVASLAPKLIGLVSLLVIFSVFTGCGKSDKEETKTEQKQQNKKEQLDTSKFYSYNNMQYWQNYPGKLPSCEAVFIEVKDQGQVEKIKKAIAGETKEDVYTCEMHPQIHQNYMGKCPLCKMDLTKQEKNSKNDSPTYKSIK